MAMRKLAMMAIVTSVVVCGLASVTTIAQRRSGESAEAVVAALYKEKPSPFLHPSSRAVLKKYFSSKLADLIWQVAAKKLPGENDARYDSPDTNIKNLSVGKPQSISGDDVVQVAVSFDNSTKRVTIGYLLIKTPVGWRISDAMYQGGYSLGSLYTLKSQLKN
jgi:hypothetical protein